MGDAKASCRERSGERIPGLSAAHAEFLAATQRLPLLKQEGDACHAALRRAYARMEAMQASFLKGGAVDLIEIRLLEDLIKREEVRRDTLQAEAKELGGKLEVLQGKIGPMVRKALQRQASIAFALQAKGGRA
ncbi:hypothetical protein [Teichococcus aestuarii]|uniref:Uncharacterized protein n=1 Tax=Teichococcus aestuarii TaxID=568898 RepID=A0A2U1UZ87_9PROT|nr:hypothetical protein [Pseudoroseomonas aestuarii]PWC26957.1 hypothetical protein CR165_20525 [Pseudoroseomonas aestuarii]